MATYVSLIRFIGGSPEAIRTASKRLDDLRQSVKAMGAELKACYVLMGQYDALVILDAPDEEAAFKAALSTFASGGAMIETVRAFTEDEFRKIIASMS